MIATVKKIFYKLWKYGRTNVASDAKIERKVFELDGKMLPVNVIKNIYLSYNGRSYGSLF